ncbi:hypothetical protein NLX67_09245 [Domibacillus sp. A3M-37]|nr:hypothetical protein [Domibacillus sp. A3M-37]MCP3762574.1 hypothetical protein [Domibacillus sp. A3M-37]
MRHEFYEYSNNPTTEKWLKMCPSEDDADILVYTLEPTNPESNNVDEAKCENIEVNGGSYDVTVSSKNVADEETKKYYVPIEVKVRWKENEPEVELDGTIKSEDMR